MVDFHALRSAMIVGQVLPTVHLSDALLYALETFPREMCVAPIWKNLAYCDRDAPLGYGRFLLATLPFVRLVMAAKIESHHTVLDVGSGAGYTSALLSRVCDHVVALEEEEALTAQAHSFLQDHHLRNVTCVTGNPLEGWQGGAPYDVIVVEGTLTQAPQALLRQLKEGGRLVCFLAGVDGCLPQATLFECHQGQFFDKPLFEAAASPLAFVKEQEGAHVQAA